MKNPTRAACGACHNDVNFATGENHVGGPQINDKQCSSCHIPQGELEFDASIRGAHLSPVSSSQLTGLAVNITNVQGGTAGRTPIVSFTVQDGKGNSLPLSKLSSISFTMAGPTTDYGYTSFGIDTESTPGYVTESAAKSSCDINGNCTYTFTHQVPSAAKGTYAIGVEARRTEVLLPGTTSRRALSTVLPIKLSTSLWTARR
jgi:OmcA/MtrC family decaheme c-type cytochrome